MGQMIELSASDGQSLSAYRADAESDARAGIVVIQEIFGLNAHVRDVCDRLAGQGYTAVAPALFDRIKPGIELGYSEEDLGEGFGYMQEVGNELPMLDIQTAADVLKAEGKVGAVGFCWGGQLAWLASKNVDVDCSVGYYGVAIHDTLEPSPNCPVQLHFADNDQFVPPDAVVQVRAAYPDLPIYNYPADHGFNCDVRDSYHQASAAQAMERTLAFLGDHIG